jgi:hypothetical protein
MMSKFFLSLTAFSLALNISALADEVSGEVEFVEQVFEEEIADAAENEQAQEPVAAEEQISKRGRRTAFPQKTPSALANAAAEQTAQKPRLPKRRKPHFAGVRRPLEEAPKALDPEKTSKKAKSPWFSSKTQPKNDKKQTVSTESDSTELPSDRPYFRKVGNTIVAPLFVQTDASGDFPAPTPPLGRSAVVENDYPRTGFQAPNGHVYLSAEWLFWRTRQEGMEFASSKQLEFDFQSGFRVGLGVHLPSFDGWSIDVNYTRFNPQHSHSVYGAFYPLFLFQGSLSVAEQGNAVAQADGHWAIEFQSVDIELGKSYYLSKTLVLSPFFGLKGAWIDQHARFRYLGGFIPAGQVFRTHFKNDFKGAGPLLGTEVNWQLGGGFSLFGDIIAALIIGHFDNGQEQYQLSNSEVVHLDHDYNLVSPVLEMVGGVAWDRNFNKDQCHYGLSAGFETQYWWSQNQTEQFTDDVRPIYVRQRGDLAFYGLTLRARFDF